MCSTYLFQDIASDDEEEDEEDESRREEKYSSDGNNNFLVYFYNMTQLRQSSCSIFRVKKLKLDLD